MATKTEKTKPDETRALKKAKPEADARPVTSEVVVRKTPIASGYVEDLWKMAGALMLSPLLPPALVRGRNDYTADQVRANVYLCIGYGAEIGLSPMQSLSNVMVVNNRPTVWGDGLIGVIRASGLCEFIKETVEGSVKEPDTLVAICHAKRSDTGEEIIERYEWADAVKADLTGSGTYKKHPKRMLKMRARGFCLRDLFADVLKGFAVTEIAMEDMGDSAYQLNPSDARPTGPAKQVEAPKPEPEEAEVVEETPPVDEASYFCDMVDIHGEVIAQCGGQEGFLAQFYDYTGQMNAPDIKTMCEINEDAIRALTGQWAKGMNAYLAGPLEELKAKADKQAQPTMDVDQPEPEPETKKIPADFDVENFLATVEMQNDIELLKIVVDGSAARIDACPDDIAVMIRGKIEEKKVELLAAAKAKAK